VPDTRIPFNRPSFVGRELELVTEAIARGQLSGDGYFTKACHAQIKAATGAKAALLTHSCTAALEMAAILCDLAPGDEVIMPSFTFVSTANAVVLRGAVPVFVDIDPATLNIDPAEVAAAVTPKTKAITAVHYAGFPADMDPLSEIAAQHGLVLVEDAAQAYGSSYKGRPAGALGDMAAFSFHETKNIISGEGGALTLMRPDLVERAEIIREKGTNRSLFLKGQVDKYTWVDIGSSFLPGELIAAFLHGQLEMQEEIRARRLGQFGRYMAAFAPLEAAGHLRRPVIPEHTTGNGHMFYLILPDIDARDALIGHLRAQGIVAPFHYVPLHSAPAGRTHGRASGDLPVTKATSDGLVRLPLFYTLGDEIEAVIGAVRAFFGDR
jgi:dTDP-4-amino-4,6-dideoxygalactose transaminase